MLEAIHESWAFCPMWLRFNVRGYKLALVVHYDQEEVHVHKLRIEERDSVALVAARVPIHILKKGDIFLLDGEPIFKVIRFYTEADTKLAEIDKL